LIDYYKPKYEQEQLINAFQQISERETKNVYTKFWILFRFWKEQFDPPSTDNELSEYDICETLKTADQKNHQRFEEFCTALGSILTNGSKKQILEVLVISKCCSHDALFFHSFQYF